VGKKGAYLGNAQAIGLVGEDAKALVLEGLHQGHDLSPVFLPQWTSIRSWPILSLQRTPLSCVDVNKTAGN